MTHQLPAWTSADELARRAPWRKSSWSSAANGCVEAADVPGVIAVRDSRDPHGPVQLYSPRQWTRFIAGVRNGVVDR
jgi:hypothetical protein